MGLISKIEEKLSGSSGNEEQNKLQKPYPEGTSSSGYTGDSKTSDLTSSETSGFGSRTTGNSSYGSEQTQHPISSSGGRPTGTAVDNYGSNTTSSATGNQGTIAPPAGYSSTSTTDRMAQPTTTTTTSTSTTHRPVGGGAAGSMNPETRYEPKSPYDPYSIKGQQTAANAATTRPMEDMRSTGGQTRTIDSGARPIAGDARTVDRDGYGMTSSNVPSSQTTSSHHYGRDAGIAGGAGAAGVGAYELGKHSGTTSSGTYNEPGMSSSRAPIASQPPTSNVASQPQEAAYLNRDTLGGQQHQMAQDRRPFVDDSAGMGGAGAMGANTMGGAGGASTESADEKAKKMSDAYQAGYRDGMEHMKAEMQKMQLNQPR